MKKQRFWCIQYCTKRFPEWRVGIEITHDLALLPITDSKSSALARAKELRQLYKKSGNRYARRFRVREMLVLG